MSDGKNIMRSPYLHKFEEAKVKRLEECYNDFTKLLLQGSYNELCSKVNAIDEEIPVFIGQYFDMSHNLYREPIKTSKHVLSLVSFVQEAKTFFVISYSKADENI